MSEDTQRPLDAIRKDIDSVDAELVRLLSRRTELAEEVGKTKGLSGKPYFTPERERAIYEKLREINPGPLAPSQIQAIYREIMSAARSAEKPLHVLGSARNLHEHRRHRDFRPFDDVRAGRKHRGCVPRR